MLRFCIKIQVFSKTQIDKFQLYLRYNMYKIEKIIVVHVVYGFHKLTLTFLLSNMININVSIAIRTNFMLDMCFDECLELLTLPNAANGSEIIQYLYFCWHSNHVFISFLILTYKMCKMEQIKWNHIHCLVSGESFRLKVWIHEKQELAPGEFSNKLILMSQLSIPSYSN